MYALPKLEGAPNFRELGGYAAPGGRRIRPGRVFRSQGLHALTDSDLDALRALDIRLVCDLRSERERILHPSRWPQGTLTQRLELDIGADVRANNRKLLDIMQIMPGAQGARSMMIASYGTFPQTFAKPLARIFSHILSDDADAGLPVLVHCSAGKDRTGFVIAMMLSALGVSREVIFEDYMQTEKSIDRERLIQMTGMALKALLNVEPDREVLDVIASITPDFLGAAFASIENQYGTVENYLASACGLDAAARERFSFAMME
jgi:protein-tyrosine phosphatase